MLRTDAQRVPVRDAECPTSGCSLKVSLLADVPRGSRRWPRRDLGNHRPPRGVPGACEVCSIRYAPLAARFWLCRPALVRTMTLASQQRALTPRVPAPRVPAPRVLAPRVPAPRVLAPRVPAPRVPARAPTPVVTPGGSVERAAERRTGPMPARAGPRVRKPSLSTRRTIAPSCCPF
jgi:hypothetical protein